MGILPKVAQKMCRSTSAIMLAIVASLLLANFVGQIIPAADALCSPYGVYNMKAVADGNNLYVMWEYETSRNGQGGHDIFFKHSADGGKTFSETTSLHHSGPRCTAYPHMAVEGSNVYVMWEDGGILFRASNDNGRSFGKTVTLGEGFLGNVGTAGPFIDGGQILASGDRVYAVWNDAQGKIIFRKSDDYGRSFGPPVNVSKSDSQSTNPRIAASGNSIYVAWSEDARCEFMIDPTCSSKVLFAKGYDPGASLDEPVPVNKLSDKASFGEPMPLDKLTGGNVSMPVFPSVAADGNNVYLLWEEKDGNVYFSSSGDRGQTFSGKSDLSKNYVEGWRAISIPSLWVQNENVYVLWQAAGENGYLLLKSTDNGKSFARVTQPMPKEFDSEQSVNRQMIIDKDGRAYLLWSVFSETERRVSFATGYEGRLGTGNQTDLVENSSPASPPSNVLLVASHDNVYVLWLEDVNATESSYEQHTLMRASADGGKSFGNITILEDVTTVPEFGAAAIVAALAVGGVVAAARFIGYKRTNSR